MSGRTSNWSARFMLLLLVGVFLVPVMLSWWFLNRSSYVHEGKKSNYGSLIRPAHPLPSFNLSDVAGQGRSRTLAGRWSILYILPGDCDEPCQQILSSLYRVEQALGKDSLRIQRVVLLLDPGRSGLDSVRQSPGLWLLESSASEGLLNVVRQLRPHSDLPVWGQLYLIDPLGNLMMRYGLEFDPFGVIRDLERLLKASKIG